MKSSDLQLCLVVFGLLLLNGVTYLRPRLAYLNGRPRRATPVEARRTRRELADRISGPVGAYLDKLAEGGAGAYTLFAPAKSAWARAARRDEDLASRLGDHVLARRLVSADVPPHGLRTRAVSGAELYISAAAGGGLSVNGVATVLADADVGDGIVHVLADVLPSGDAAKAAAARAETATRSAATARAVEGEPADAANPDATEDDAAGPGDAKKQQRGGGRRGGPSPRRKRWHFHEPDKPGAAKDESSELGALAKMKLADVALAGVKSRAGLRNRLEETDVHISMAMKAKLYYANRPCHGRGRKSPELRGACSCAVLYEGMTCERSKSIPSLPLLGRGFERDVTLSQVNIDYSSNLVVHTAAKTLVVLDKVTPAVREQMKEFLPQDDPLTGKTYRKCALVGSSGVLMRHFNGKSIDASDFVVRFNSAPTRGYEQCVGTRTDLRLSNGEHIGYRERNETIVHHLKATSFLFKLFLYAAKFPPKNGHPQPLAFHPEFTSYVAKVAKGTIPSSGLFAVMLALNACEEVTLYGFHASFKHGSRHHYYDYEVPSNERRDDTEFNTLKAMRDAGLLSFAEPCLVECHADQMECNACIASSSEGGSLEELALRERWTPVQRTYNEAHAKRWKELIAWDKDMDKHFAFDAERGLTPKR